MRRVAMTIGTRILLITCASLGVSTMTSAQEHAKLRPVPFTNVRITDEFWAPKLSVVADNTLPHCFQQCDETGRLGNFDRAAGKIEGKFEGLFFNDSDVYKVIEGAAYALMHERDPKLEAYLDELIARIAAAQQDDGYLNTYFTLTPSEERWSNCRVRHELYCAGHLLEAAVAHHQATGKPNLLNIATRFIDYIDTVFGPGKRLDIPGHQEIELALVKLYHLTGEERFLKLAEFFIEQRGHTNDRELYGEYCQDHVPVREHTQIVGHAVRAMYLYSGVADIAAITGDQGYIDMMDRIWRDTINAKMYITGGIGSSQSNEGFTDAYDLPNESAYCETCAAIALCFWSHRLNLLHADAKYFDVLERALYNNVLAGLSLDGKSFFYVNPLVSRGGHHRQPWYRCACCPSNVVRFIPSVGQYIYAHTDDAIYANLYVAGTADVKLGENRTVQLTQETHYPWDGSVKLTLQPEGPQGFDLYLRIPAWCESAKLEFNGKPVTSPEMLRGYVRLRCEGMRGYTVELELPMPIQRIQADPRVEADVGRVALQRGPIVYCLEGVDNESSVLNCALPRDTELTAKHRPDLLGGVMTIRGKVLAAVAAASEGWEQELYQPTPDARSVEFTAIPYYAWDNRDPGEMVVWLPEALTLVERPPVSWVTASASHCNTRDTLLALHDRKEPADSNGRDNPRFTWWPRCGSAEWVQYDFDAPRAVSFVEVYWFDDSQARGHCRTPASWKLSYRDGDAWRDVPDPSDFGVELDRFNRVTFDPVTTDGLRIEVQLQDKLCAGILEWIVGLAD
ncbi:MAG: glycoside hydrolase family 127 protein [Planctomycetes bacterium]|nr:glycoside hydrolase family 127 protein [Planctomycetota bacterium]